LESCGFGAGALAVADARGTYGRIDWDDHGLQADAPVSMVWLVEPG
jgi:hypothetical protein